MNINEAKELILKRANAFHERYFTAYGQIMLRLDDNTYAMSRENLRLSRLTANDINIYDINTGSIGKLFHSLKGVNAIVVICTEASLRYSASGKVMQPMLNDLSQIIGPDVQISQSNLAKDILQALKNRRGCFIKDSGILSIGTDIEEAIAGARIIEKCAEAEMFADKVQGLQYIPATTASESHQFYNTTYSKVNRSGSVDFISDGPEEFRLRNELIEAGKKMCWSDLVQGSWGNLSVRLNDHQMLITPTGMDYFDIKLEDIVRVDINTLEYGPQRAPSTEANLHAAIYRTHPECQSVIHTHSNGISVFAAGHAGFKISNPEMHQIIGDLKCTDYFVPGSDELSQAVIEALEDSHACIMANHGAIFYSHDLALTLAIADAVESRACKLLDFGTTIHNNSEDNNSAE